MHGLLDPADKWAVLDDYPPVDKPDRLPLRQRWIRQQHRRVPVTKTVPLPVLARTPRYIVTGTGDAGEIRAASEDALREARVTVAAWHRAALAFDRPFVHQYRDVTTGADMEPWIFVRLDAPRVHHARFVEDLRRRGARLQEIELQRERAVIRAHVRLAAILGLQEEIHTAVQCPARVATWLVRYEPAGGGLCRAPASHPSFPPAWSID